MLIRIATISLAIWGVALSPLASNAQTTNQAELHQERKTTPTYTAVIINGQLYLQLNTNPHPDGRVGPFLKQREDRYTHETSGKGTHVLYRLPNGKWFYEWTYIQMHAESVDAHVLATKSQAEQAVLIFLGTVIKVEASPLPQSNLNWIIHCRVDQVLSGDFQNKTFSFRVHSPVKSGIEVGKQYEIKAKRTTDGYTVDQYQWKK